MNDNRQQDRWRTIILSVGLVVNLLVLLQSVATIEKRFTRLETRQEFLVQEITRLRNMLEPPVKGHTL